MALKFILSGTHAKGASTSEEGDFSDIVLPGSGPATVMLIHGMTGTPNEMRHLANYLNRKQGHTVVCPRLANHGRPLTVLKKTKWPEFYQSARDSFAAIRKQTAGPVFVSGLSMGALLSLLLAADFPDDVAGVSCLSPTLFYDGWNIPWLAKYLLPLFYATPIKHISYFKEEPPYGIKSRALQARIHKYYSAATIHDQDGAAEYGYPYFPMTLLHELQKLVKYLRTRLPDVHVPVQLIQAREDDITSVRNSTFLYEHVASVRKELVLLEDCYHVITADQERATVAHKMQDFFHSILTEKGISVTGEAVA